MSQSETQESSWSLTEDLKNSGINDESLKEEEEETKSPTAGKRKNSKAKVADAKVADTKEEKKMTAKEKRDAEFATILATRAPEGTNQVSFVALAGKNNSGGIYVPTECVFVFNSADAEQYEKVKEAIVAKARKWKKRCPDVPNPFWLIDGGSSVLPLTAVGGVDRGCTEIPTRKKRVVEDEVVEKKSKRARK